MRLALYRIVLISAAMLVESAFAHAAQLDQSGAMLTAMGATSGDSLVLEVKNRSRFDASWTAPPGIVAEPLNGQGPAMLVRRVRGRRIDAQRYEPMEAINLKSGEGAQFVLEAYSLDIEKKNPEKDARYIFTTQRPDLVDIFSTADQLKLSGRVVQAAIWLATSDLPREKLKAAIPIPANEFATASELASRVKSFATAQVAPPAPLARPALSSLKATPSPGQKAPVTIGAEKVKMGQTGESRSATVTLKYTWNVPDAERPRIYIVGVRFESSDLVSAVVPGKMIFDEEEGSYESVVEQGVLKGKGELVYAVLREFTEATDQSVLEQKFDSLAKGEVPELMSNVVRVPVNWQANADSPLDAALSAISAGPTPESAPGQTVSEGARAMATSAAASVPTLSAPLDKTLAFPVQIHLPLANGGVLEGRLIGLRQGKLVLVGSSKEMEFAPAHLGKDASEILSQAKQALAQGRPGPAMQLATIAGLMMKDPAPAAELYEQANRIGK